jgi:hypothetical protein
MIMSDETKSWVNVAAQVRQELEQPPTDSMQAIAEKYFPKQRNETNHDICVDALTKHSASLQKELDEAKEQLHLANQEISEAHDWDVQFCDELVKRGIIESCKIHKANCVPHVICKVVERLETCDQLRATNEKMKAAIVDALHEDEMSMREHRETGSIEGMWLKKNIKQRFKQALQPTTSDKG